MRLIGKERHVSLDSRFYAAAELQLSLSRLAETDERLNATVSQLRKRPRKRGKAL